MVQQALGIIVGGRSYDCTVNNGIITLTSASLAVPHNPADDQTFTYTDQGILINYNVPEAALPPDGDFSYIWDAFKDHIEAVLA